MYRKKAKMSVEAAWNKRSKKVNNSLPFKQSSYTTRDESNFLFKKKLIMQIFSISFTLSCSSYFFDPRQMLRPKVE